MDMDKQGLQQLRGKDVEDIEGKCEEVGSIELSAVVVESIEWDKAGKTSKLLEDIEVMGAKLKSGGTLVLCGINNAEETEISASADAGY